MHCPLINNVLSKNIKKTQYVSKKYVLSVQTQDMKGNCDKIYEIYKSINAYYIVVVVFFYVQYSTHKPKIGKI